MSNAISEVEILNDMVAPDLESFSPEGARALLALQFTPAAVQRMNELAEKNRLDSISAEEKAEMEKYMLVGNVLSFLKAKARLSLARNAPPQP